MNIPVWAQNSAAFFAGILATALVNEKIRRVLERPRPSVKITDVSLSPSPSSAETPIVIDVPTRYREKRNMLLPGLEEEMNVKKLRNYIDKAEVRLSQHRALIANFAVLRDAPNILDPALSEDDRRADIIKRWMTFGNDAEALVQTAIDHFMAEVPKKYKDPHPTEWKTGPKSYIRFGPSSAFNLGEIDVAGEAARIAKEKGQDDARRFADAAERTNVERRFWIHLDTTDLRWLFSKVCVIGELVASDAEQFVAAMRRLVATNSPEYLRIQIMVSNDGNRAMAVRTFGCLRLQNADPTGSIPVNIPVVAEPVMETGSPPTVVLPASAVQIAMASQAPLASLEVRDAANTVILDGERLKAVFRTHALKCQVAVTLEGFGLRNHRSLTSGLFDFGLPVENRVKKEMAATIETSSRGNALTRWFQRTR